MPEQLELSRNCIIRPIPGHWLKVPHRLLEVDAETDLAYVFKMRHPLSRPQVVSWQQLQEDWYAHLVVAEVFTPPPIMLLSEGEIPEDYRSRRDKWWGMFTPLLSKGRYLQLLGRQGEALAQFAKKNHITKKTTYRYLYRFFYYGCIPNAFLPRFELRGGHGHSRLTGTTKLGRPRKAVQLGHAPSTPGFVVTDEDRAHFLWALETYWAEGEEWTFKDAYERLCHKHYSEKIGTQRKLLAQKPSYDQFVYQAKKLPQFSVLQRRRIGEKKWDRNFRSIVGKSSAEVLGPADRYQIDATIADIYLTSIYNRNWIIGRPVIYVVVDVFSGYIVGLYVGLEGPSWEGARLALLNAFTDKTDFLTRYGFGPETEWLAHHIPVHVFADRAELLGDNALGLTTGLGITIDIASSYRPDWKGIVERKFGIANDTVIHFLPGAVLQRIRERGERDYALDGTLNLHEFAAIIIRDFLHFNKHHRYKDRCTPAMIEAGIPPTPAGLWRFGMDHLVGGTPCRSREEIHAHLLPQGSASVREDGIHFQGLRYTSPYAMEQRWFEKARFDKRFRVNVKYHMETPERIWIVGKSAQSIRLEIHEAKLLDPYKRYEKVRWEEAMDLLAYEDLQSSDAEDIELEERLNVIDENSAVVTKARKELKIQRVEGSANQRKRSIRKHRANEKAAQRKVQALQDMEALGHPAGESSVHVIPRTQSSQSRSPTDAMILRVLRDDEEVP